MHNRLIVFFSFFLKNMDDEEGDSSRTEPNSGKINERQNINSTKDVKTAKNGNSTTDTDKAGVGKTRQSSSLQQAKPKGKNTPKKSETGYMGLRKGFLL